MDFIKIHKSKEEKCHKNDCEKEWINKNNSNY